MNVVIKNGNTIVYDADGISEQVENLKWLKLNWTDQWTFSINGKKKEWTSTYVTPLVIGKCFVSGEEFLKLLKVQYARYIQEGWL